MSHLFDATRSFFNRNFYSPHQPSNAPSNYNSPATQQRVQQWVNSLPTSGSVQQNDFQQAAPTNPQGLPLLGPRDAMQTPQTASTNPFVNMGQNPFSVSNPFNPFAESNNPFIHSNQPPIGGTASPQMTTPQTQAVGSWNPPQGFTPGQIYNGNMTWF